MQRMDQIVKSPLVFIVAVVIAVIIVGGIMASIAGISPDAPMSERYQTNAVAALPSAKTGSDGQHEARVADAAWVVDPTVPGASLPPVGRSLFDYLVTREQDGKRIHDVPFPFATLMKKIETQAGYADSGESVQKPVLIPLGRSLQRNAAAPDFFKYPRVVVAVDGESQHGQKETPMLLKDRLYLGYQEKANLIEVISYNEAAGRFEFQVVKDYGAGMKPKVFYANRTMCMSCHQNGAPIFSRPEWDETNANPKVAALLKAQKRGFHGVRIDRGVDIPNAIDNATDRANLLAAYQLLWREGCGLNDDAALQCRAGLFLAALQYRLSGQLQFERRPTSYREKVAERLLEQAARRWPQGLAIGNPDIPNRDPLPGERGLALSRDLELLASMAEKTDEATRRKLASLSHVSAPFEPLNLRPPLEVWRIERLTDTERAVRGLAEFLAEPDLARLDAHLRETASRRDAPRLTYRALCSIVRGSSTPSQERLNFSCVPPQKAEVPGARLEGRLELQGARVQRLVFNRFQLDGQGQFGNLDAVAPSLRVRGGERRVTLKLRRAGLAARGADGNAVERVELVWSGSKGTASAIIVQDFAPVEKAVAAMLRASLLGHFDGFSGLPFRRARLMPALFAHLGMEKLDWCCLDTTAMPPAERESVAPGTPSPAQVEAAPALRDLQGFYRYCANCHMGVDRFPPNFLAGRADEAGRKIAHCAERIQARLAMWRREPDQRAKTPMPPASALAGLNLAEAAWRESGELAQLGAYMDALLKKQSDRATAVDAPPDLDYENLRPCLPEEQQPAKAER